MPLCTGSFDWAMLSTDLACSIDYSGLADWQVIESPDVPADIDGFNTGNYLKSTTLPVSQIGHGASDLSAKFEAVYSSIKLDASWTYRKTGHEIWNGFEWWNKINMIYWNYWNCNWNNWNIIHWWKQWWKWKWWIEKSNKAQGKEANICFFSVRVHYSWSLLGVWELGVMSVSGCVCVCTRVSVMLSCHQAVMSSRLE